MLGELPKDKGLINVTGRIAYVSQQPWVFSGTVRSNILFDKEYEKEKYEKVLKVCALKKVWFFFCSVFTIFVVSFVFLQSSGMCCNIKYTEWIFISIMGDNISVK